MRTRANRISAIVAGLISIGSLLPVPLSAQTITAITNAASGLGGGVSPGEVVVIYGNSLGPATLIAAQLSGATSLPTSLGSVTVSFNQIAAPIVYVSASQISVQVPNELAGSASAGVVVSNGNATSPAFSVPVVAATPGLFTANFTGTGQLVALNVGGPNSVANPVPAGESVVIFATGEGATYPTGIDGAIQADTAVLLPVQPVSVEIGGMATQVLFCGSVPGDIPGIIEIGVLVPANLPASAAAPVVLTIGSNTTTQRVTLAVQ